MATLPTKAGAVSLLDVAKATDPDGRIATVAELLSQYNEILTDMPWIEGNLTTGHRSVIRTGLPTSIWRKLYQGVPASKSLRATVDDTCGMLETRAEIDKDIAELGGNANAYRMSEAPAFLESLNQTMAEALFYGDASLNPERFTGLTPRFSSLSAGNGSNVLDAGGTSTDNTSVWLVVWGPNTVHGIYPKGSQAGLVHEDLGLDDALDANGNRYRAYMERWQWKCGISVRDWRYIVRIANVDVSDLLAQTGTQAQTAATNLIKMMIKAFARIPSIGQGTPVFYANRTVKEMLSVMAMDRSSGVLSIKDSVDQFGRVGPGSVGNGTLMVQGVPVRTVDVILNTEARVV